MVADLPSQRSAFQAKQLDVVFIDSDSTTTNALKQAMPTAIVNR